ncbi:hypothetical protein L195_g029142, partial [Trifolium pratense]
SESVLTSVLKACSTVFGSGGGFDTVEVVTVEVLWTCGDGYGFWGGTWWMEVLSWCSGGELLMTLDAEVLRCRCDGVEFGITLRGWFFVVVIEVLDVLTTVLVVVCCSGDVCGDFSFLSLVFRCPSQDSRSLGELYCVGRN